MYIFGRNKGRYNQYPDDYTYPLLAPICSDVIKSKAIILRNQDLMHYIYAENLGDSNIIGICLIFNKAYIKQVSKIFTFLRELIESTLLKQAKIIRYNNQGNIEFTTTNISDNIKSFVYVKTLINSQLDSENNYFGVSELTSTYNGIQNSETVDGNTTDSEILRLQQRFNKIIINYKKGIEEDLTKIIISELQVQISKLNQIIENQKHTISELEKTKKQYKYAIFLFIVLLCSLGGLSLLYTSLNKTERDLKETTICLNTAIDSIHSITTRLTQKQNRIESLQNIVREERQLKEAVQNTLDNLQSNCPVIITGTSCSLSSGEYVVRYYAKESASLTFNIKVFDEKSGSLYTKKTISEFLNSGAGSFTIYFNRSFNPSDWYTFEIWNENRILGGSRH